jgi:glycosyltransferase involved in cell wall biosynthesis
MGDLWAGAEVQLLALMKYLVRLPGFEWTVILFNDGKLADELRRLPLSLTVISEKEYGPVTIAFRLAKQLRRIRPDIVHTHKYKDSVLGSIVARCLRVPNVVRVVHGMPEPFKGLKNLKMAGYTFVDRLVTRWFVDKVVAVSSDIETVLAQIYEKDRVVRIHNGIDLEAVRVTTNRLAMRRKWRIDDNIILIGTAGRLVPVKGHTILLKALHVLAERHHNVRLILLGDGPLRNSLETEVRRLGLEEMVIFAGHQEQSYDFINMMDIFVLPSLHEGIPMVLLEALALKKPVIASRVGGIPEVISHGVSGMLVNPGNVAELAAGLHSLIQDQEKASLFGVAGRTRVEEEFDAALMAKRTIAIYRSLCDLYVTSSQ